MKSKILTFLCVLGLLFLSCSKEEVMAKTDPANMATLSFGTLLNNIMAKKPYLKKLAELPDCSAATPAFVEIVLSQDGNAVVGTISEPLRIEVNQNPSDYDRDGIPEYFTEESANLELTPGTYSLNYFTVLDASGAIIWVSPIKNGQLNSFSNFVDTPLPFNIDLRAGVKKYVDVEVLCFDNREVNEYGYLFFDFTTTETFTYCFFANFCNDAGRHYPAAYSVDIWLGTDNSGAPLYSGVKNKISNEEGLEPAAEPVCFVLPNPNEVEDGEPYIYYEVTLMDWEGVYGDVAPTKISGKLSRNDIIANFAENNTVEYKHLRFGCDSFSPGD